MSVSFRRREGQSEPTWGYLHWATCVSVRWIGWRMFVCAVKKKIDWILKRNRLTLEEKTSTKRKDEPSRYRTTYANVITTTLGKSVKEARVSVLKQNHCAQHLFDTIKKKWDPKQNKSVPWFFLLDEWKFDRSTRAFSNVKSSWNLSTRTPLDAKSVNNFSVSFFNPLIGKRSSCGCICISLVFSSPFKHILLRTQART